MRETEREKREGTEKKIWEMLFSIFRGKFLMLTLEMSFGENLCMIWSQRREKSYFTYCNGHLQYW